MFVLLSHNYQTDQLGRSQPPVGGASLLAARRSAAGLALRKSDRACVQGRCIGGKRRLALRATGLAALECNPRHSWHAHNFTLVSFESLQPLLRDSTLGVLSGLPALRQPPMARRAPMCSNNEAQSPHVFARDAEVTAYAHTRPGSSDSSTWQPLFTGNPANPGHLENVAELAAQFASAFGASDWARLAAMPVR